MNWNFPLIFPGHDQTDEFLIIKVLQELSEFGRDIDAEKKGIEALDVLHAAETLVRKFFDRHPYLDQRDLMEKLIRKNAERGYYQKK